jgi:thiol-disulfide isomerase/thioredoxin
MRACFSSGALMAALLGIALLAGGCGESPSPSGSRAAPDTFTLGAPASAPSRPDSIESGPLLERSGFDLDEYEGEVVLLNFWATWCAPCRAEMPDLVELQQDLGPEGLQIIGVATDRQGREAVTPYLERQPVNYPIVLDPEQEIGARYGGVAALPTTLVIGRGGEVQNRIVGRVRPGPLRERLEDRLAGGDGNAASGPPEQTS